MKKIAFIVLVLGVILSFMSCSANRKVVRIDSNEVVDLSGRWNDTDSRLVSSNMIQDLLSGRWILNYESAAWGGKLPVVVVGTVQNKSHEHIDAETFIQRH